MTLSKRKKQILIVVIAAILVAAVAVALLLWLDDRKHSPRYVEPSEKAQAALQHRRQLMEEKRTGYTLIADNESMGVKLYSFLICGVPSDDFYMEFYDPDGTLTKVTEPNFKFTEPEIAKVTAQVTEFNARMGALADVMFIEELNIRRIRGEWVLTLKEEVLDDFGCCIVDEIYYNALTGEKLPE